MSQFLVLVYIFIASHGGHVVAPVGPWPEGHIRIIRGFPIFWDNHVDGVPK